MKAIYAIGPNREFGTKNGKLPWGYCEKDSILYQETIRDKLTLCGVRQANILNKLKMKPENKKYDLIVDRQSINSLLKQGTYKTKDLILIGGLKTLIQLYPIINWINVNILVPKNNAVLKADLFLPEYFPGSIYDTPVEWFLYQIPKIYDDKNFIIYSHLYERI